MLLSFELLSHLFCFYQSIKKFYKPSVFCYICNENDISFFVWDIKKCRLTLPGHCVERYNWCDIDTQCDTCYHVIRSVQSRTLHNHHHDTQHTCQLAFCFFLSRWRIFYFQLCLVTMSLVSDAAMQKSFFDRSLQLLQLPYWKLLFSQRRTVLPQIAESPRKIPNINLNRQNTFTDQKTHRRVFFWFFKSCLKNILSFVFLDLWTGPLCFHITTISVPEGSSSRFTLGRDPILSVWRQKKFLAMKPSLWMSASGELRTDMFSKHVRELIRAKPDVIFYINSPEISKQDRYQKEAPQSDIPGETSRNPSDNLNPFL